MSNQKNVVLCGVGGQGTVLVKVVEIGLLPRSEKKTKRVIDERYE